MGRASHRSLVTLLVVLPLAVVGCGGEAPALVRYDIPGTGYSIEHPEGWQTASEGGATLLAETEEVFRGAFETDPPPLNGLMIVFDHREVAFMTAIGLDEGATLLDLFLFNVENFDWRVLSGTETTEVLGEEALVARVSTPIGVSEVVQGYLPGGEEIFLLQVTGPDAAALDAFDATWDAIVAGIGNG